MRKISHIQLISNLFIKAIRTWKRSYSTEEIISRLIERRTVALADLRKSFAIAIFGAVWLEAREPALSLKIPMLIKLTVSAVHVNFVVAIALAAAGISLINYFLLDSVVNKACIKLHKDREVAATTMIYDGTAAWTLGFPLSFKFFESSRSHFWASVSILFFLLLPFFLICLALYGVIFNVAIEYIWSNPILSFDGIFTVTAMLITLLPLVILILLVIPFKYTKNVTYIRWIFLSQMHRKYGVFPPRASSWLDKRKT